MITWVDRKLVAWGMWVQLDRGQGSKGLSANWGEPGGGGHHKGSVPIKSLDTSRTHDWVRGLVLEDQWILVEHYCTPRTAVAQAAKLKMSLRTLYRRLHELHCAYAAAKERADQRGMPIAPVPPGKHYTARARVAQR
jgi:hypothetical protein